MSYATIAELREALPQVPERKQQTITVTATGGTFTLSYEGVASSAIAYNALASVVKSALNAVATINGIVETVSGPAGGPWIVTFNGTIGNDASPLVPNSASLTGPGAAITVANTTDAALQRRLDAATQIIDNELDLPSGAFSGSAASTQTVYGDGTIYLAPARFVGGSVTLVETISGGEVPDYIEQDGMLIVTDADGVIPPDPWRRDWGLSGLAWREGIPYEVSATFGYASVPPDIKEACLEIAVRMWRAKDAGFSDVVGVEGSGAVGYNGALPNMVKRILDRYRETRNPGVY